MAVSSYYKHFDMNDIQLNPETLLIVFCSVKKTMFSVEFDVLSLPDLF